MGHDVFISHSAKDKATADAVCAALEASGIRCWIAPRDIVPGETWAKAILRGIASCRMMVLVFSSDTNSSPHVAREVERAVHRRMPIAPVRIEAAMPTGDLEFFLSSSHWMDVLTPPLEQHLQALAGKVRALMEIGAARTRTPNPTARATPEAQIGTRILPSGSLPVFDRIEIREPEGLAHTVPIRSSRIVIGRSSDATLRLNHSTVSRHHAELVQDPYGRWWVQDLDSRNGAHVNGVRVSEYALAADDSVRIGKFQLRLLRSQRAEPQKEHASPPDASTDEFSVLSIDEAPPALSITAADLNVLLDFSERLGREGGADDRRKMLCELVVGERFIGQASMIVTCPKEEGEPEVVFGPIRRQSFAGPYYVSRSILRAMSGSQKAVMGTNVGNSQTTEVSLDRSVMPVAGIACPVSGPADVTALYVAIPPDHATPEWLAMMSMASRLYRDTDQSWRERERAAAFTTIERELERARSIQRQFTPRSASVADMEVAVHYEPCRWVGGDYADIIQLPDGRTFVGVGDVAGKGLHASLITAALHTLARTALMADASLSQLFSYANAYLRRFFSDGKFMTMVGIIIDPKTGKAEYANAGHPAPVVVSAQKQLRQLESCVNAPLGLETEAFQALPLQLEKQEMLVMYTDGLTDLISPAGDRLGTGRWLDMIRQTATARKERSARSFGKQLFADIEAFRAGCMPPDDRTLLACRRS